MHRNSQASSVFPSDGSRVSGPLHVFVFLAGLHKKRIIVEVLTPCLILGNKKGVTIDRLAPPLLTPSATLFDPLSHPFGAFLPLRTTLCICICICICICASENYLLCVAAQMCVLFDSRTHSSTFAKLITFSPFVFDGIDNFDALCANNTKYRLR